MKIVIVGGSGGIGLPIVKSFLRLYSNAHYPDFQHPRLQWQKLDVTREDEIKNLSNQAGPTDILVNAVGILHTLNHRPEKSIKEFDPEFFKENITTNTLPSILLAKHFMSSLKSVNHTFYVVVSAKIGSISDNRVGGWLSYRASKAALNMTIKTISIEWKEKIPNCCVLLFHPGTTNTQLSKPFQKNLPQGQVHSPELTASALIDLIQNSNPSDTGKFISFDGNEIPW